ncbi:16S rRNA (uracil(1498)-N(3))-methyltransferase [Mycoplasmopsis hyopharyngis]|uniref:16S rRNA (uracil(1498)-N(3))-methyltransferase n=1 Tax=Mycoplasmopsis hyopharyngis TaxID=29558 RepID=UPI003872E5F4
MYKFFVDKKINQEYFELNDEILKHLKVIRIGKNEKILCNYENEFYECVIENNKAKIITKTSINNEYQGSVILGLPIIKIKNFELVIQKATELGVSHIVPILFDFSDSSLKKYVDSKTDRLCSIAKGAAEQSFRNKIPTIYKSMKLNEFIKEFSNIENKYFVYENANEQNVKSLKQNCLILVGPEGGFSQQEIKNIEQNSFITISLGKRILRSETACIAALSRIFD